MKMEEYQKVKDMTYLEYCDYLQEKYGIGLADYMTKSFNKNSKVTRTKEGLIAHHKMEDRMIMLSTKEYAKLCPFEWQLKENIVYCDYLEHLLLHVLICKYPSKDAMDGYAVGIGGVVNWLVPELNDVYSGFKTSQKWRRICHSRVRRNKEIYLMILRQFIEIEKGNTKTVKMLCRSFNSVFGYWDDKRNYRIYHEIASLFKDYKNSL